MSILDNYLMKLNEGAIWDKVKKVWKSSAGVLIPLTLLVGYVGIKAASKDSRNNKPSNSSTPEQRSQAMDNQKIKGDQMRRAMNNRPR